MKFLQTAAGLVAGFSMFMGAAEAVNPNTIEIPVSQEEINQFNGERALDYIEKNIDYSESDNQIDYKLDELARSTFDLPQRPEGDNPYGWLTGGKSNLRERAYTAISQKLYTTGSWEKEVHQDLDDLARVIGQDLPARLEFNEPYGWLLPLDEQQINQRAFLDTIAYSEYSGYRTIVGLGAFNNLIADFSDHPRQYIWIPQIRDYSSAAGKFQFLDFVWDSVGRRIELKNFTPVYQRKAALYLIWEEGAQADVLEGRFDKAAFKVRNVWASLPDSQLGQATNSKRRLKLFYHQRLQYYNRINQGIVHG